MPKQPDKRSAIRSRKGVRSAPKNAADTGRWGQEQGQEPPLEDWWEPSRPDHRTKAEKEHELARRVAHARVVAALAKAEKTQLARIQKLGFVDRAGNADLNAVFAAMSAPRVTRGARRAFEAVLVLRELQRRGDEVADVWGPRAAEKARDARRMTAELNRGESAMAGRRQARKQKLSAELQAIQADLNKLRPGLTASAAGARVATEKYKADTVRKKISERVLIYRTRK